MGGRASLIRPSPRAPLAVGSGVAGATHGSDCTGCFWLLRRLRRPSPSDSCPPPPAPHVPLTCPSRRPPHCGNQAWLPRRREAPSNRAARGRRRARPSPCLGQGYLSVGGTLDAGVPAFKAAYMQSQQRSGLALPPCPSPCPSTFAEITATTSTLARLQERPAPPRTPHPSIGAQPSVRGP